MNFQFYVIFAFVLLVGFKAVYLRRSGRSYPLNTTVSNMNCGVLSLCTGVGFVIGVVRQWITRLFAITYSGKGARLNSATIGSRKICVLFALFLPLIICTGCLDAGGVVIGGNARWIKRNYTPEFNAHVAGSKFSIQEMELPDPRAGFPSSGELRVRDALWGGVRFNAATEGNVGQEFFYSLARAQVRYPLTSGALALNYRVHNFGMNGLVYPTADKGARTRPFLSAGVGGVVYRPAAETRNVHQFGSDASFTFNYGGGLKQRIGSRVSWRTDLRHFIARTPTFNVFPHRGAIHNLELSTGIVFHQRR